MNGVDEADLVVGAGTHLDTHTAAICDARGRVVSQLQIPASTAGYVQVLAWARQAAGTRAVAWAVEGTRHYGLGLARHLTAQGEQVAEIDCSRHIGKRRAGKSDPIDAVRAARELLARPAPVPVSSGRTDRHRLNRLGDRQLNRAIHTIAVTRMRCHQPTQAYVQRRRAEGKTDREIRRCIKRYLARHLYRTLNNGSPSNT